MSAFQVTVNDRDLIKSLRTLPERAAQSLQNIEASNFVDWKREVVRSSDVKDATARRNLRQGVIMVNPKPRGGGRSRGRAGRLVPIDLAAIDDAKVIVTKTGRRLLVQERQAQRRGRPPRSTIGPRGQRIDSNTRGTLRGTSISVGGPLARRPGYRTEIIGSLHERVKNVQSLDFFGSWDRLQSKRVQRYRRLLIDVTQGRLAKPTNQAGRRRVTRIRDVEAEGFSVWRGYEEPSAKAPQAAAKRIEKRVGKPVLRPWRKRYLLIPSGRFLTPRGTPRRRRR